MRRLLATALTALSALGIGGIAHGAGVFAEHAHPPVKLPPPVHPPSVPTGKLPPLRLPPAPSGPTKKLPPVELPPTGQHAPSDAIDAVKRDASDPDIKTVLCAAYQQFYDPSTNSVQLPSDDGVLTSLAERLLPPTTADWISGVLQTNETRLQSLNDGDLHEVLASLACS
jgi:hypothetical protein